VFGYMELVAPVKNGRVVNQQVARGRERKRGATGGQGPKSRRWGKAWAWCEVWGGEGAGGRGVIGRGGQWKLYCTEADAVSPKATGGGGTVIVGGGEKWSSQKEQNQMIMSLQPSVRWDGGEDALTKVGFQSRVPQKGAKMCAIKPLGW